MGKKVCIIFGTRPEIIKTSPVIRACTRKNVEFITIHTGQHYSEDLNSVFFEQLNLPTPDYNLEVGSGNQGEQTGKMISRIEPILYEENPDVVLVQGDTNSVLAGAITAAKIKTIELGHIEAGLRSFDKQMPEEINRRVVDHMSDYLFAPTQNSYSELISENISPEQIYITGNTIVDSVLENVDIANDKSTIPSDLGLQKSFALLTAHRVENVDERDRFTSLLNGVAAVSEKFDLEIVYPIHPRAKKRLSEFDITVPECIRVIDPLNYLDFLKLEDDAKIIFTDSGGVQEESCILQTPCITLRDNTERPETVEVGANRVVGTNQTEMISAVDHFFSTNTEWENPFGEGDTAEQILRSLNV